MIITNIKSHTSYIKSFHTTLADELECGLGEVGAVPVPVLAAEVEVVFKSTL